MKIAGIIAEYNPFHNGHLLQVEATRAAGVQAIVAVMGGNWLQRGAPALCRKQARARAALLSGVDLVLELPLPYAAATAERFAFGGVEALAGLGCVDTLSFGSEAGDLALLTSCAAALEEPLLDQEIRARLERGVTYAAARQQGVEALFGPAVAAPFSSPNNILAIQYIRELRRLGMPMEPFTVERRGAGHHEAAPLAAGEGAPRPTASATWLRGLLEAGRLEAARPYLPEGAWEVIAGELGEGRGADPARLELPMLAALRRMSAADFALLPDVSEGLEHRLVSAVRSSSSVAQVLERVKTKRYTHARLRRILVAAYLGLPGGLSFRRPPYLRVLGMNETGARVLREAKSRARLPISHSLAQLERLGGEAGRLAALESRSTDLYTLLWPQVPPCGTDYTESIIKV